MTVYSFDIAKRSMTVRTHGVLLSK